MKERIPRFVTVGGDLCPSAEIRGGSSAVPWCMKPLSHSSTPRINASSLVLQSPCTRGQTSPEKTWRPGERKSDLVLKQSEQSTLHDYRELGCPEACRDTHQPRCPPHACDLHHWFYSACHIRFFSLLLSWTELSLCRQQSFLKAESIKLSKQIRLLFCISFWLCSVSQI